MVFAAKGSALIACLALFGGGVAGQTRSNIQVAPSACEDCIRITTQVSLSSAEEGWSLSPHEWVVRDTLGRIWAMQHDGPRVFTSSGRFIAKPETSLPGVTEISPDFGSAFVDARGRVHIFDFGDLREIVYAGLQPVAVHPTPAIVLAATAVPGVDRYVATLLSDAPELVGIPVHVVERANGTVVASMLEPATGGVAPLTSTRVITIGPDGLVYTAPRSRYEIDVWSLDGTHLKRLTRDGLWAYQETRLPVPGFNPDHLNGSVWALRFDSNGYLWVATWIPRPDWTEHAQREQMPIGGYRYTWQSPTDVLTGLLEVIDLDTGQVIARADLGEDLVYGFLGDRLLYGPRFTDGGEYQLEVRSINFSPTQTGGRQP